LLAHTVPELSGVLGAAYESFLKGRLERRAGRRGKVHVRTAKNFIEMVAEMIEESDGHDADELWHETFAELDRDRAEIEADVLAHHGFVVVEHEWAAMNRVSLLLGKASAADPSWPTSQSAAIIGPVADDAQVRGYLPCHATDSTRRLWHAGSHPLDDSERWMSMNMLTEPECDSNESYVLSLKFGSEE